MTTLFVDGVNQGDGVCVRMHNVAELSSDPVPIDSSLMACGHNGETPVSRTCGIKPSSKITFGFRQNADDPSSGAIAPSHRGPCAVYMKRVADATASHASGANAAAGPGWFKIWELDYDSASEQWCTQMLIANNGFLSVDVPRGLEAGDYLVRTEILALHDADKNPPDPQFFVGCAQVFLESGGGGVDGVLVEQPETVSISEGTYDLEVPGLTFNVYESDPKTYPMFGPPVFKPRDDARVQNNNDPVKQTKGLRPAGCVLERDNWCAVEVPEYSSETQCWEASEDCWGQSNVCWSTPPPTGNALCEIWQDRCHRLDEDCISGRWTGPEQEGDLTPEKPGVGGSMDVFTKGESRRKSG
ncbi:glycosyl hydrolase family 61-domain-containing protein [Aspergillus taichungensis]|uniref:AA9 family lytic polysaccharide monooxygenase n=1 Tax=Aspergillus taichungensis TaxID=482145 RepID=A0A2J5HX08_9EURO|nr:glycosyl hydrolase family 61-domain-containing protein [Aspergillus taichungensis]